MAKSYYWMGKPVNLMTREELIRAVEDLMDRLEDQHQTASKCLELTRMARGA